MDKDDVILDRETVLRLAREASHGKPFHGFFPQLDIGLLEAFAKLVAEHSASVEREACAKVCEQDATKWGYDSNGSSCAIAIRARVKATLRGQAS